MWRRVACVVGVVAVLTWQAVVLLTPTSSIRAVGKPAYAIDALSSGQRVGQTFRILEDGLDSVSVQLSSDRTAAIDVVWRLLTPARQATGDGAEAWAAMYQGTATRYLPRGRSRHDF